MGLIKIAVASSLQGFPEESSPGDNLDTRRIGLALAKILDELYGSKADVQLWNRDDFPGQGDAFVALGKAINAWGADITIHVHQDAGPAGARGYQVLYYQSLTLAEYVFYDMAPIHTFYGVPIRGKGLDQRIPGSGEGVYVLSNANMPTVLIECGFYTSPADEAVSADIWATYIAKGVAGYIRRHIGDLEDEEDDDMTQFSDWGKDEKGRFMIQCPEGYLDRLLLIDAWSASDIEVEIFLVEKDHGRCEGKKWTCGGWLNKDGVHGAMVDIKKLFSGIKTPFAVEVHCEKQVNASWQR